MSQDAPTLLLIHGLGATSGVWADLREILDWPGPVVAVDLPGHGAAPWTGDYTLGAMAAAVSVHGHVDGDVYIVGHSLGGCVALALASGFFKPIVRGVVSVGVKAVWTTADVDGMAKVAAKGIRWFDTEAEATDRFLLQAGLNGLVDHNHPAVVGAVTEDGGRWRVAQDPATFAQRAVPMDSLMAAARCPVILGAGGHDPMVTADHLAAHVDDPRIAAGLGHNVQVEDPAWVAGLVSDLVDRV
jgi:pimeloyl-ACP methyl ester carboxylesterase